MSALISAKGARIVGPMTARLDAKMKARKAKLRRELAAEMRRANSEVWQVSNLSKGGRPPQEFGR